MACQAFVSVDAFLGDPLGLGSCDDCQRPFWEHEHRRTWAYEHWRTGEHEHRRTGAATITRDAKTMAKAQYEAARQR